MALEKIEKVEKVEKVEKKSEKRVVADHNEDTKYFKDRVKLLKGVVDEFPWKIGSLTAVLVGCSSLYGYLISIEYVPSDLLGIMALGSIAAFWFFVIWVALTIAMFGTVAVINAYEVKRLGWWTVIFGQIGGLCMSIAWLARGQHWWWFWFAMLGIAAFIGSGVRLLMETPRRSPIDFFMAIAAVHLGSVLVPLGFLIAIVNSDLLIGPWASWTNWRILQLIILLLVLTFANTLAANARGSPIQVWGGCLIVTAAILLVANGPAYIGSVLASRVGIRMNGVIDLRVPQSTCLLVVDALAAVDESTKPSCKESRNKILAEVQLKWGSRWLLRVKELNGTKVPADASRVFIPDEGTMPVLRNERNRS